MRAVQIFIVFCLLSAAAVAAKKPALVMSDIDGVEHRLVDLQGKWVVINYWATWCPPCLAEIQELELFYAEHQEKDAVVWGVNREDIPVEELKRFIQEQYISYPIFQVKQDAQPEFGAIPGIPTTYLISPAGEVVARQVGGITAKTIEDFIQQYEKR